MVYVFFHGAKHVFHRTVDGQNRAPLPVYVVNASYIQHTHEPEVLSRMLPPFHPRSTCACKHICANARACLYLHMLAGIVSGSPCAHFAAELNVLQSPIMACANLPGLCANATLMQCPYSARTVPEQCFLLVSQGQTCVRSEKRTTSFIIWNERTRLADLGYVCFNNKMRSGTVRALYGHCTGTA